MGFTEFIEKCFCNLSINVPGNLLLNSLIKLNLTFLTPESTGGGTIYPPKTNLALIPNYEMATVPDTY